jgi:hypothetical protein
MALNVDDLATDMVAAALPILRAGAEDAAAFAQMEFAKIAQTIVSIETNLALGNVTPEQAGLLLQMQSHASRAVLLTLQGLALLTVEAAINAALNVVKTAVNSAVRFPLIA